MNKLFVLAAVCALVFGVLNAIEFKDCGKFSVFLPFFHQFVESQLQKEHIYILILSLETFHLIT